MDLPWLTKENMDEMIEKKKEEELRKKQLKAIEKYSFGNKNENYQQDYLD